ncbi:hypothetical protein CA596_07350 [Paenibacillus odorifer]|nr:hypothetical protein CA596_07350 [Paenibacillus odorifer]
MNSSKRLELAHGWQRATKWIGILLMRAAAIVQRITFLLPSCKAALAGFVDGLYYKTLVRHPYQERVPDKQLNYVNELEFVHRLDIF